MARSKSIAVSAADRQTAVGAELIQLLEGITTDGRINKEEVRELGLWLAKCPDQDIPAIEHLRRVIGAILRDGKVTPEEVEFLHKEVEAVLPMEIRRTVRFLRKQADKEEKEKRQAEAERNARVERFDVMVVGVHFEGRDQTLNLIDFDGADVALACQPNNPHDSNAVAVLIDGQHVGYIPREDAADMSTYFRQQYKYRVEIKKLLAGRTCPIPVLLVDIHKPDAEGEGLKAQSPMPHRQGPPPVPPSQKTGETVVIVIAAVVLVGILIFALTRQ